MIVENSKMLKMLSVEDEWKHMEAPKVNTQQGKGSQ